MSIKHRRTSRAQGKHKAAPNAFTARPQPVLMLRPPAGTGISPTSVWPGPKRDFKILDALSAGNLVVTVLKDATVLYR